MHDRALIDLRSDTLTQPTAEMRRAMAEALVGDEQKREDPTVIQLENREADLLGLEEAVFVPSATMANQIALRLHTEPGDEVLALPNYHIFRYELGGPAVHSGVSLRPVISREGFFSPPDVRAAYAPPGRMTSRCSLLWIENTFAEGGGRVWPPLLLGAVAAEARAIGLHLHLDGSRLMNSAVAAAIPARGLASHFDSVTFCLTKGLGCPVGSLIAGDHQRMSKARRLKQLFGGGMRQAGILAAAGLYALDHHVTRLAQDHENARRLARGLADVGLPVDPAIVDSNIVLIEVGRMGLDVAEAITRLRGAGVLLSLTSAPGTLRAVTYLGIATADVDRAVRATTTALLEAHAPYESMSGP